ncbi:Uu.00g126030.m01.CDS01 [Anthostomella pinea]|uniref:Uu.00g126030.m01.CDS01 n=1 Tax=Anthostomella pinea TaxID=933095 RepID=A0AAI8VHT4_9PEZI|nr:Uu.00g126030.m01.CDS01 [Anthostomella pinea]
MATKTVQRCEANGISVIVAGAGVGGLTTALECWRKGCDVRIFERTREALTSGDSFTIGPTALDAFKNWPFLQQRTREISYHHMIAYHHITGERFAGPLEVTQLVSTSVNNRQFHRHSRPKFHAMLSEQLAQVGIQVEYGKAVVDYAEDAESGKGSVVLEDGSGHQADLVVAADGVKGRSWGLVAGQPVPARSSGNAIYRVAYPVGLALADPAVAERFPLREDGRSVIELWIGSGMNAFFWRNQDEMQWLVQHEDSQDRDTPSSGSAKESWSHRVSPEEVIKYVATIPGWPEIGTRVIRTTPPDQLVHWKLMWRDPQPKWTSPAGRVVQLGDAAHTFLPSSGNGGTQAMEDAISLAACLAMAGSKENVPDAIRMHNLLRFERVSCLQAFGVLNRQKNTSERKQDGSDAKQKQVHIGRWILEHDPEQYVVDNYEKALECLRDGGEWENTNIPPGLVYRPWTIDGLLEAQAKGEPTVLDGDWD